MDRNKSIFYNNTTICHHTGTRLFLQEAETTPQKSGDFCFNLIWWNQDRTHRYTHCVLQYLTTTAITKLANIPSTFYFDHIICIPTQYNDTSSTKWSLKLLPSWGSRIQDQRTMSKLEFGQK